MSAAYEIEQAMYRYARALDRQQWDRLDTVFAPDIETDYGVGPALRGREAVVRNIIVNLEHCRSHHMFGNVTVEVRGDEGESTAHIRAQHIATIDGKDATLEAYGEYFMKWRATPEGWRAYHLRLSVIANIGDRAVLAAHFKK